MRTYTDDVSRVRRPQTDKPEVIMVFASAGAKGNMKPHRFRLPAEP